jgi:hypothetical protein
VSVRRLQEFNENPQVLRFNRRRPRGKFVKWRSSSASLTVHPAYVFSRMTCTGDRRCGEEDVPWTFN